MLTQKVISGVIALLRIIVNGLELSIMDLMINGSSGVVLKRLNRHTYGVINRSFVAQLGERCVRRKG